MTGLIETDMTTVAMFTAVVSVLLVALMAGALSALRRRPRLRRVAKWTGTLICITLVVGGAANLLYSVTWTLPNGSGFGTGSGGVGVSWRALAGRFAPGLTIANADEWLFWPPLIIFRDRGGLIIQAPIWFPLLMIGIPTIVCWRLDRRRLPPGYCPCGYDLTGNVSGVCPECGEIERREIECRCDSLSELNGKQADDYLDGHLEAEQIGRKIFYVCPDTRARWEMKWPQGEFHGGGPSRLLRVADSADETEQSGR